jgi:IS30 family transposase
VIDSTIHNKRTQRKSIASNRYCRIEYWSKLESYILEKIQQYYSPKQISWRWAIENKSPLSKDTIYSYIYNNYPELISKYFRRKWKKYQHKRKQKYQLDNRRMIDKRPKIIEQRTTLGHWESDTVVGKRKTRTKNVLSNPPPNLLTTPISFKNVIIISNKSKIIKSKWILILSRVCFSCLF